MWRIIRKRQKCVDISWRTSDHTVCKLLTLNSPWLHQVISCMCWDVSPLFLLKASDCWIWRGGSQENKNERDEVKKQHMWPLSQWGVRPDESVWFGTSRLSFHHQRPLKPSQLAVVWENRGFYCGKLLIKDAALMQIINWLNRLFCSWYNSKTYNPSERKLIILCRDLRNWDTALTQDLPQRGRDTSMRNTLVNGEILDDV